MAALLLIFFLNFSAAQANSSCLEHVFTSAKERQQTKVKKILSQVVKSNNSEVVEAHHQTLLKEIEQARAERPQALLNEDLTRPSDWYLKSIEYMFYLDQFATPAPLEKSTFYETTQMLPYLKDLGVDVLYILPFFKSPRQDGGFDVSNYRDVDENYGGMKAFDHFVKKAQQAGFKIKLDLVLNHVSEQHEWFQKLLQGDLSYRDYFITRDTPPEIIKTEEIPGKGKFVFYREKNASGKWITVKRRLIFPDISDTHYRHIKIPLKNGTLKDLWVYHSFYPFQLDLNIGHPQVLNEFYQIIAFWANKGVDIFRLDAIPFLDKGKENHLRTYKFVELLSYYLKQISPKSILMVEASQPPKDMLKYLGKDETIELPHVQSVITRTDRAQMAYEFELMKMMWGSIITQDKKYLESVFSNYKGLPRTATFTTFLRVHDELTLEFVEAPLFNKLLTELGQEGRGIVFGNRGIAGRLSNLLDHDIRRIRLAYALLMGLPGLPVIYFGDEIQAQNNRPFMEREAEARKVKMQESGIEMLSAIDGRDAGRGEIEHNLFTQGMQSELYQEIKNLIHVRKISDALTLGRPKFLVNNQSEVISFLSSKKSDKVLGVYNLSAEEKKVIIDWNYRPFMTTTLFDRISKKDILIQQTEEGKLKVTLPPYGVYWLDLSLKNLR